MGPIPILVMVMLCAMQPADGKMPLHTKPEKYRIPGQYIIVLKDDVDVNSFASAFEASVLRGTSDGKIKHKYQHTIKGFSARLSTDTVDKLRESKHVKYIEEDGIVHTLEVSSWGLGRVDQRNLPLDGNTPEFIGDGTNVHLYIIDTGTLYAHEEFSGRTGDGADFIGDQVGFDCNGHGTHCGGTAGGTKYGIASKATIHSVRVLGCDGSGTGSDVIKGYDWVAFNKITPAVASVSLGGGHSPSENYVVQRMINAGVVVSVAAGNDDQDACLSSPASAPEAITVGATDSTDKRASFSNYGSCVDIFAPGVSITSSYIADPDSLNPNSISNTVTIHGTSMACPHVSGAAAALLSVDGSLITPAQVKARLLSDSTVNKVTDRKLSPNKLLYIGRTTAPPTPCNSEVTRTGQVTSPGYYPGYDNDMTCNTIFDAGAGKVVSLNFLVFEVEYGGVDCAYDSLSIYDSSDTNSNRLGKYCGETVPDPVFSTGRKMLLVFKSDFSVTYAGFRADVDFVSATVLKTMWKPTPIIPQKGVFDEPDFKTMWKPTPIIPQKGVFDEPDAEKSMKPTPLVPQLSGDPGKNEENISEKDVANGSN